MKKLNNRGISIIEVLICFTITAVIVVSLFKVINNYKDRQDLASYKSEITAYKDTVTNTIQEGIINHGGVMEICNQNPNENNYHCDNGEVDDQYNDGGRLSTYMKMEDGVFSFIEIVKETESGSSFEGEHTYSIIYQEDISNGSTKEEFNFPDIEGLEFNEPSIHRDDRTGFLKIYVGSTHRDFNDKYSVLDIRVPLQSIYPNAYRKL